MIDRILGSLGHILFPRLKSQERSGQLEDLASQLAAEKGEQAHAQDQNRNKDTSKRNSSKKVVKAGEIEKFMNEGWEPVMTLPDGRIIMRAM